MVCVAAPGNVPTVVERRRVTLIEPGLPTLPYHHESIGMPEDAANSLIARVRQSIAASYQLALCRAARDLGLEVDLCRRDEETARAAARLGVRAADLESFVSGAGRPSGPPWTQEHRRAFAAGIAALAARARRHHKLQIRNGAPKRV
jgi:hypothetical protein